MTNYRTLPNLDNAMFENWLRRIDRLLLRHMGVTHRDIADRCYRDMHDDGLSPFEVVAEILEEGIDAL